MRLKPQVQDSLCLKLKKAAENHSLQSMAAQKNGLLLNLTRLQDCHLDGTRKYDQIVENHRGGEKSGLGH